MILGGTSMTDLKKQCFANSEIRLGWSEVDDDDVDGDFVGDEKVSWNAKHMVSDFKNTMEIGDIVVIEKSNKSIDAIGVVTGDLAIYFFQHVDGADQLGRFIQPVEMHDDFLLAGHGHVAAIPAVCCPQFVDDFAKIVVIHVERPILSVNP